MLATFKQFMKFGTVGALNTIIDLSVLNALMFFSGIADGTWFSVFKGVSAVIGYTNSYFWNRNWTFSSQNNANVVEFSKFFGFSAIGLAINVSIASFIVNFLGPLGDISPQIWANVGALLAVSISLVWNFLCYKFLVFRK